MRSEDHFLGQKKAHGKLPIVPHSIHIGDIPPNPSWSQRIVFFVFYLFCHLFFVFFFGGGVFLGLHLWHMEVPRVAVELEL